MLSVITGLPHISLGQMLLGKMFGKKLFGEKSQGHMCVPQWLATITTDHKLCPKIMPDTVLETVTIYNTSFTLK
jgi:hypothetical protein